MDERSRAAGKRLMAVLGLVVLMVLSSQILDWRSADFPASHSESVDVDTENNRSVPLSQLSKIQTAETGTKRKRASSSNSMASDGKTGVRGRVIGLYRNGLPGIRLGLSFRFQASGATDPSLDPSRFEYHHVETGLDGGFGFAVIPGHYSLAVGDTWPSRHQGERFPRHAGPQ